MKEQRGKDLFDLTDRVIIITGGAGLLGEQHARAIAEKNGRPVLIDIKKNELSDLSNQLKDAYGLESEIFCGDICDEEFLRQVKEKLVSKFGRIDALINNAALNPQVSKDANPALTRLEEFPVSQWMKELQVGLTGAFICSRVFGEVMSNQGHGVIINVSSDLGLIAPDQRLYQQAGLAPDKQPTKPVTYSVIKHGLIGLTRYLSTYWINDGVRSNAICPGGVELDQSDVFIAEVSKLIPMGRMAKPSEYKGAIQFLCSDASTYMNGACLTIDGGRSAW